MANIPFVDLKAQYDHLKQHIDARIHAVLEHGQFIQGPEVRELEQALADYAGCQHVVAVGSGTDALHIALLAEGIGKGDAVFLPAFTFTATAEVVLSVGAVPVFCDVDGRDFNLVPESLEQKIAAIQASGELNPAAVIVVDLFGLPAGYSALRDITLKYGLRLIGDGAQSFGGSYRGKKVGALADVTAASFFPAKPLGCYGDGGALLTDDEERASIYRSIGAHGKGSEKYDIVRIGMNSRLDTLQAAVLLGKLISFNDEIAAREKAAERYDERLSELVITPLRYNDRQSAWAQYGILLDDRDRVASDLKRAGIPTAVYYPQPMHLQTAYRLFGTGEGSLPVSEALSQRILHLPMHGYLSDLDVDRIADELIRAVKRR
jgi:UDP-2-acetamido-2-deoxy-ribo-hexuluronate aminotransferase